MDISIIDCDESVNTYVTVRYGEHRRQAPLRKGEVLSFLSGAERCCVVDVYRKLGSQQVSLAGITALGGTSASEFISVPDVAGRGTPIRLTVQATLNSAQDERTGPKGGLRAKKEAVAAKARGYLAQHGVHSVLQDMFTQLIEDLPAEPLVFMVQFLERRREEFLAVASRGIPSTCAHRPGLGPDPLSSWQEGDALPDLKDHHSLAVDVLREDPGLYARLQHERTMKGVSLNACVRSGVECPGHEFIKATGCFAGDMESYERYGSFFDPVIATLHAGYLPTERHVSDMNPLKLSNGQVDLTGKYAVFAVMEVRRNFPGFRFGSCVERDERRQVEQIAVGALLKLAGQCKGSYYPLAGSSSWSSTAPAMLQPLEERLLRSGLLFREPDSRLTLSAGLGRHWPDARGVFTNEARNFYAWCNEEDHLRLFSCQHAADLKTMWLRMDGALQSMKQSLTACGRCFAHTDHLGFVTACPSRLGSGLRVTVSLKIPLLAMAVDLPAVCRTIRLQCSQEVGTATHGSVWNITNTDSLGVSEVDIINCVLAGCATLVELEQRLERRELIYDALPGLGDEPLPGFPCTVCPARMPSLGLHRSLAAQVLREQPDLYKALRGKRTAGGVTLAPCVKPLFDDRLTTVSSGIVAADAECYETFDRLFLPVICKLHGDAGRPGEELKHQLSPAGFPGLSQTSLSPAKTLQVRVDLRRNLKGRRLAPGLDRQERRDVERVLVRALVSASQSLDDGSGEYHPLSGSTSFAGAISMPADQARLRTEGALFDAPAAPAELAAGLGLHWPDARGSFRCKDLSAWINEEDHLRAFLVQETPDLKAAFLKLATTVTAVEDAIKQEGSQGFAFSGRLGYLSVSPEHLGCGLACAVTLRLPRMGARGDFNAACGALRVRNRWSNGGFEISSGPALGYSEVELVNLTLEGCAKLVALEEMLDRGQDEVADSEIQELMRGL